jgi:hypothetical protein
MGDRLMRHPRLVFVAWWLIGGTVIYAIGVAIYR